jgi:hypothetical protein
VIALTVGIATATAGRGNAKKCQKNGWQTLVTSTGQTFANEEACTSYGARGGVLYPLPQAPCLNGGWQALAQRPTEPRSARSPTASATSRGTASSTSRR